jgi:multidrug efflux pump subunit AcrB
MPSAEQSCAAFAQEIPMQTIERALDHPAAVAVGVAMVAVLGLLALFRLPLQLFPDVERPQLTVQTSWRSASPQEVESEVLEPMESVLRGLPGALRIDGSASPGGAMVWITFGVDADLDQVMLEVLGRLNRMPPLPRDADPPVVSWSAQSAGDTLTFLFVQKLPTADGTIDDQRQFIFDTIRPRLEAIPGVAAVEVDGAAEQQVVVEVDLARAAQYGVLLPDLARQVAAPRDVSGGFREFGRRSYALRLGGRYSPQDLGALILGWRDGRAVTLADVAQVRVELPDSGEVQWQNGNPAIGMRLLREPGANVLETLDALQSEMQALRSGTLGARGLTIEQGFDSGLFIRRALALLGGNLGAGVLLAIACVWLFLRDRRATLLIAAAIPIALLATMVVLHLFGRTLNVISLAGLAFAVGMVMDAAIVVAENISRLRAAGLAPRAAALQGTLEVRGALIASTLTTVAVFLPVVFLRDAQGQIFADLALAVSIAVAVSLLVALLVLPVASSLWWHGPPSRVRDPAFRHIAAWIVAATATRRQQLAWVAALVIAPLAVAALLRPDLDYLPPVKRAAIDADIDLPPGMSARTADAEIGALIRARMAPFMSGEREPQLLNWSLITFSGYAGVAARVVDPSQIGELERVLRDEVLVGLPDTRISVREGELFGGFGGSARAIEIDLQGPDLDALARVAASARERMEAVFPGANVGVYPETEQAAQELLLLPRDRRLAEIGWTRDDLTTVVRVLGDGNWLGEYFDGDRRLAVVLRGQRPDTPEELALTPLATPGGGVVPLSELARLEQVRAPTGFRRVDGRRTLTVSLEPPQDLALGTAIERVEQQVLPSLRAQLPPDASLRVSGSADQLQGLLGDMAGNFALALFALWLVMAAMFRSAGDALVVLFTLPLALVGGVLGLRALAVFAPQPLDLLSMIGFVMLLGMVVNNGILLLARTRDLQGTGRDLAEAIRGAVEQRLRPIMVGALTGVVSALPMAISPGPGAVIYRGLAAVTVGGVALSLLFTAVLVPALVRLTSKATASAPAPAVGSRPDPITAIDGPRFDDMHDGRAT